MLTFDFFKGFMIMANYKPLNVFLNINVFNVSKMAPAVTYFSSKVVVCALFPLSL